MKKNILLVLLGIVLSTAVVKASYVSFQPYQVTQPDGKVINCFVSGDEYFNWLHDAEGFTIIQAPDGFFYYGMVQGELVVPSEYKVGAVNPETAGLRKWAKVSLQEYERRKNFFTADNNSSVTAPHTGTLNNLVIYIKFSDDAELTTTRQTFDNLFNLPTGSSLKSYYTEVSYNQLTISSTHYPACAMNTNLSYTDTHPRSYFQPYNATTNPNGYNGDNERAIREQTLLRDAVNWINVNSPVPPELLIDSDNDGHIDNISFIVKGSSGAWSSLLWPHQWVLYMYNVLINGKQLWEYTFEPETSVSVTTTCHEMFHTLGAPDLYHYTGNGINPVWYWDLMEYGSGHMGAYMKWKYTGQAWIASIPEITSTGTYTLNSLASSSGNCYKIASPNSASQYYVVEYRKKTGTYEGTLPGSGLLAYRIDPSAQGNASGPPDEVYIYRPDGTTTTNGTPNNAYFSSESGRTTITDATNPSGFLQNGSPGGLNISNVASSAGNTITFNVTINFVLNPLTLTATAAGTTQIDLAWQQNPLYDNVMLAYSTSPTFGTPVTGTAYSPGATIAGGGTVIYSGSGTTFSQVSLNQGTTYYYKLWSANSSNAYSYGLTAYASTQCDVSSLPLTETFTAQSFPACWSEQHTGTNAVNSWTNSATNYAGGTVGEIKSIYQDVNLGITRLVSPAFNTVGTTQLSLSFRHLFDDFSSGATLRVESSSDGISWTNEAWSLQSASDQYIGPAIIYTNVSNNLNSPTTYIALSIEGNLYSYDGWYIDNVSAQNASIATSIAPNSPVTNFGSTSVSLTATVLPNTGGGTVSFYVNGSYAGLAAVNAGTGIATLNYNPSTLNAGNYPVRVDFGSYNSYMACSSSPSANGALTVNKAEQSITFGPLAAKTYGDAQFTLSATASSNLTVSYSSSNTDVATVSGNTVTITGIGNTDITASQAGNINYNPAIDVTQPLVVNAQGLTWTGAVSTDWADASNWSPVTVPSANHNLTIANVANKPVINQAVTNPAVCNNLTIAAGSTLTVAPGKALTVNGILVNSAGSSGLLINSGSSLIEISPGVEATVNRFMESDQWHLISSPVADAISNLFLGKYLQKHTESTNLYTDITSTTEPLTPAKGFALWGDAAPGFTTTWSGLLNTGELIYNTTYSGIDKGWNLVGNPYPSSIDWNAVGWTKTNINNAIYIHVNSSNWATYIAGASVNGGTRYIAPGQGFFIRATANGSIGMGNNVRVHNATAFFKSSESVYNSVRLSVSGNGYTDEALVRLVPEATAGFDGDWDAYKLFGDVPEAMQIYTLGNTDLAINTLPVAQAVPVGIRAGIAGSYIITGTEINGFTDVTLEDTKTGTFTDLSAGSYVFYFMPDEPEQRFILHFGPLSIDDNRNTNTNIYSYHKTVYVNLSGKLTGDIYIYNVAGQLISSRASACGMNEISLSKAGVYIVKFISNDNMTVRKVYIN